MNFHRDSARSRRGINSENQDLELQYQKTPKEQTCGFLNRSFFIWILPFLQRGYCNVIRVEDIEEIDTGLQAQECGEKLQATWKYLQPNYNRRHQLIKATFCAYRWAFLSAIIPRLALSVFTFAQPLLITATIDYIGSPSTPQSKLTGQALVGAYVVVYVGLAVRTYPFNRSCSCQTDEWEGLKGSILAPDTPPYYHDTVRSYIHDIQTNSVHDCGCFNRFRGDYLDGHWRGTDCIKFEKPPWNIGFNLGSWSCNLAIRAWGRDCLHYFTHYLTR